MNESKPTFYRLDMPASEYYSGGDIHVTAAKNALVSARAFGSDYVEPDETTDAMVLGSAVHCLMLEPSKFADKFIVWEGAVRRGEKWEQFESDAQEAGKEILTKTQVENANRIVSNGRKDPEIMALLNRPGDIEVSMGWTERHGKVQLKWRGRIDKLIELPDGTFLLVDVKTAAPQQFKDLNRTSYERGYLIQMAGYIRGLATHGKVVSEVKLIYLENAGPYDCAIATLSDACVEVGTAQWEKASSIIAESIANNEWPGMYPDGVTIEPPAWAPELQQIHTPITLGGERIQL